MAKVFPRGNQLWFSYKDPTKPKGKEWTNKRTGCSVGQEVEAQAYADEFIRALAEGEAVQGPPTVRSYGAKWIERRQGLGIASVDDDERRLRLHVYPHLGSMPMRDVKPRHVRDLFMALRSDGKLAPRTIHKVRGVLVTMFKSAIVDEVVIASPIVVERGVLPKKADKDPDWRHQAVYTRGECEALISDECIPPDRRMLYALKLLAALRHTEAAELTWGRYDAITEPLGRINLGETKSGVPRAVPVHVTLAKMLAVWRATGWENTYGRQPTNDDLIVPTLTLKARAPKEAQDALVADLGTLGFRIEAGKRMNRRGHDLRRTFISIAQADGARKDIIEWGTHGPRQDIMTAYTTVPWPTLCEEWSKLKISVPEGSLISFAHFNPSAETVRARKRWQKLVTPKGLEPLFSA